MKTLKKQILSDPVWTFTKLQPDCEKDKVYKLEKLWQQHQTLKKSHKKTQLEARILSREIGKAKQTGQPIEQLKSSMREKSTHLKALKEGLKQTERKILDFFETAENEKDTTPLTASFDPPGTHFTSQVNTRKISISLLDHQENEWNTYVEKNPAASIYHRAEWREVIRQTYGHESFYFVARDTDKNIVGILPLIRLSSHLFGHFLVSMPYFMEGGAIADHPDIEQILMQHADHYASSRGVDHIEYRDNKPRSELPVRQDKVNMILALPDSRTELWAGFTSKLRAQIKRSNRENPKIRFGGKEYLDDFYKVYARNMRDLGSPPHSKEFIQNILDKFTDNSRIIMLYMNNRPVATGFLLDDGKTMGIPLASTIRDVNPLSINMLMYSEVLKFAIEKGFRYFDFGRSTRDSGTFRFKQQWGAQAKQLYWHYGLVKRGEVPLLSPANPKYALMINVWKRLPVKLTQWVGPRIVKNIP